jgi:hypothetical protein
MRRRQAHATRQAGGRASRPGSPALVNLQPFSCGLLTQPTPGHDRLIASKPEMLFARSLATQARLVRSTLQRSIKSPDLLLRMAESPERSLLIRRQGQVRIRSIIDAD